MRATDVSVIVTFRDREPERLTRCLRSLAEQDFDHDFEVLLVDSGSEESLSADLRKLVDSTPRCRYVHTQTRGHAWNRSHALNVGIRASTGKYILVSDADLVFATDFLKLAYFEIESRSIDTACFYRCFYLPEEYSEWDAIRESDFLPPKGSQLSSDGDVGLLLTARSNLTALQGYDEHYTFWGSEDIDMSSRFHNAGLKSHWISPEAAVGYHQWHQRLKSGYLPSQQDLVTSLHFHMNVNAPVRNDSSWGEPLDISDRPALQAVDNPDLHTVSKRFEYGDSFYRQFFESWNQLDSGEVFFGFIGKNEGVRFRSKMKGLAVGWLANAMSNHHVIRRNYTYSTDPKSFKDQFWFFVRTRPQEYEDYLLNEDSSRVWFVLVK